MNAMTTPNFKRAIRVSRSNTGCYEFTATHDNRYSELADEAVSIEVLEPLVGWGQWTHAVRMDFGFQCGTYFVR